MAEQKQQERYLINLNYEGQNISIIVSDLTIANKLITDENAALQYLNNLDPDKYPVPGTSSAFPTNISLPSSSNNGPDQEKLWNRESTIILINLVKKYDTELDRGVKKYIWKKIAEEISEVMNKMYTQIQVNTKWKGLVKTFKDVTTHNNTSGKNRKRWEFYDLMNEILFNKPEINPSAICSNYGGLHIRSPEGLLQKNEDMNVLPCNSPSVKVNMEKSDSSNTSDTGQHLPYESTFSKKRKERESAVDRRHVDKMQRLDKLQNSLDELINILKEEKTSTSNNKE